jgi:hypothetical protein
VQEGVKHTVHTLTRVIQLLGWQDEVLVGDLVRMVRGP